MYCLSILLLNQWREAALPKVLFSAFLQQTRSGVSMRQNILFFIITPNSWETQTLKVIHR